MEGINFVLAACVHNGKAMVGDFNNTGMLGIPFRHVVSVKVIVWYNKIIVCLLNQVFALL